MSTGQKFALVTGAGSGIGRSIALALFAQGWTVCLVDVNQAAIDALAEGKGARALALATDISDAASVSQTLVRFAELSQGRLDLLVNNAGLLFTGNFEDQPLEHLTRLLAVNNLGPALCCRAALPLLKASAQQGRQPAVVNISSASSVFGIPSMAIYSASKFWVRGFTEALASEWKRHGIAVRSVVPPFVNTPMLQANRDHLLMRRLGVDLEPDAVAKQVLIAAHSGPLHRPVSWRFKALLLANFLLPKPVMRAALAWLGGY
jgi:NAD(P)-dependent dehydrogenase (short-subunit alcohol dehydrogenase family)